MLSPEAVIARFAESVGRPDEVRLYLEHWRSATPERFALIDVSAVTEVTDASEVIDAPVDDGAQAALIADLHYLAAVRLFPVLVGVSPSLASRLETSRVPCAFPRTPEEAREIPATGAIAASRDDDVETWLEALGSRKLIILADGGLRLESGDPVSLVNVSIERESLEGRLAREHRPRFRRACAIVANQGGALTVGLTSPFDLLRELFTVRGAGTLLRLGSTITALEDLDEGARAGLEGLLSKAFGRRIKRDFFSRKRAATLVAGDFRGAAIVEDAAPAPYLSKFAVGPEARGEGVGRDLWHALIARFPRLVWRARRANPINPWYQSNAHGSFIAGAWTVFWRQLEASELEAAIRFALERPDDFEG